MYSTENSFYHAVLAGAVTLFILAAVLVITILGYQKKKLALYKVRVHREIMGLEKERARIANDLHDDLGSSLSAIKLKLQCLNITVEKEKRFINEAGIYIDDAMLKLKRISLNMMPKVLELRGLKQALEELVNTMEDILPVNINMFYNCPPLANEKTIHIYRIVQEVINNIVKHSAATKACIQLSRQKNKIILAIKDNGKGFEKEKAVAAAAGLGLQNILARADLLNAQMFLTTAPGRGVEYLFKIPLDI